MLPRMDIHIPVGSVICINDKMKKTLLYAASGALAVIILILLGPSGCSEATPPWGGPPALMWDGRMYYWIGESVEETEALGDALGEVLSTVDLSQMPEQDGQANMPIGGSEVRACGGESIAVWMNDSWVRFELREQ